MRLIQEQHEALVRSQRLKDALSSFVVHDLKSPLASLAVIIDDASIDRKIEPETLECLAGARESVDAMSRLILNLLDISRSDSSSLTLVVRDVNLGDLLQEAVAGFGRRAQRREIKLSLQRGEGSLNVAADADLIRRMFLNLIDNALRFSPSSRSVIVRCSRDEAGVVVRICDEGPGVPPEYAEKIFDRFFQVEARSGIDAQSNRGLGLTFCKLVAEAHGGRIWVEPNTPRGAVFCVFIPERAAGAGAR
jgi:two-component system CheB/CheR fusion protein